MPLMDGIALALAAKRDCPNLTILLMTGYADQRERARNLEAADPDVLTKPFSLSDLRGRRPRDAPGRHQLSSRIAAFRTDANATQHA